MPISDEIELSFTWSGARLCGSLHLPASTNPSPVVVMAQGSGPADRHSGGYFEQIREAFISRGVATFAFDKPGCGESSGDWREHGLGQRLTQLLEAIEIVRTHRAISGDRVGVWGHSQGGWLAQKIAGLHVPLAFAIANSGPTISVYEQILYDCEQTVRAAGLEEKDIEEAMTFARSLNEAAAAGTSYESVSVALIEPARDASWLNSLPLIEGSDDWMHLTRLLEQSHQPLTDLSRVDCPFLAVYGGLDPLLPPWSGAKESGRALETAPTADATVVVFPAGDHRLQNPATHDFVHGYLDLLGDWVAHRGHFVPGTK